MLQNMKNIVKSKCRTAKVQNRPTDNANFLPWSTLPCIGRSFFLSWNVNSLNTVKATMTSAPVAADHAIRWVCAFRCTTFIVIGAAAIIKWLGRWVMPLHRMLLSHEAKMKSHKLLWSYNSRYTSPDGRHCGDFSRATAWLRQTEGGRWRPRLTIANLGCVCFQTKLRMTLTLFDHV